MHDHRRERARDVGGAGRERGGPRETATLHAPSGTTQVPTARHTTTGSVSTSAADGGVPASRTLATTLRASNTIWRDVAPMRVMTPVASM